MTIIRKRVKITNDQRTIAAAMLLEYRLWRNITQTALAIELQCDRTALSKVEQAHKLAPSATVALVIERCTVPRAPKIEATNEAHHTASK